jgi:hypothetical protein
VKNVKFEIRDDVLIINVDLKERHGASRTGQSVIVATTEGNHPLPGHPEMYFGMNVYVKKQRK